MEKTEFGEHGLEQIRSLTASEFADGHVFTAVTE